MHRHLIVLAAALAITAPAHAREPLTLAAGDTNGDSITDTVVSVATPRDSICGTTQEWTSQLVLVDGRTGTHTPILTPLENKCWTFPTATYPTDQWHLGTVTIGPWGIVAFPMYATHGYVWRDGKTVGELVFPSTPAYDAATGGQCVRQFDDPLNCYVPNSHMAQAVHVPGGLLTLTSRRALIYRPDFTPTSDTVWVSGTPANGGRNYGSLRSVVRDGRSFAVLVGGCSVRNTQRAMLTGQPPADGSLEGHCAIHRHLEVFETAGDRIVKHTNQYVSYSYEDGPLEGRVEVPYLSGPATVFNVFRAGRWEVRWLPDPSRPHVVRVFRGRYAWGLHAGRLVTSPAPAGYAPVRRTELVGWGGRVTRVVGFPRLVEHRGTATSRFYDGVSVTATGLLVRDGRVVMD